MNKHIVGGPRLTTKPDGFSATCSCGAFVESDGRDKSSATFVGNWITEHRKQNP